MNTSPFIPVPHPLDLMLARRNEERAAVAAQNTNGHPSPTFPEGLSSAWELITPEYASKILKTNLKNRPIFNPWVNDLARLMEDGDFIPCSQGIAMDFEGNLVDGQHRLSAIVKSGVACWMLVTRGLSTKAVFALDAGRKRLLHQSAKMNGKSMSCLEMATARSMISGGTVESPCVFLQNELVEFAWKHLPAIQFALRGRKENEFTRVASIRSAIAKAFYFYPHDRLSNFIMILSGAEEPRSDADSAPHQLRNHLRSYPKLSKGSREAKAEAHRKTIFALLASLENKKVRAILDHRGPDPYQLPELAD